MLLMQLKHLKQRLRHTCKDILLSGINIFVIPECLCRGSSDLIACIVTRFPTQAFGNDSLNRYFDF